MADLKIRVYRGQIVPYKWYWCLVGENGKPAATSHGATVKQTALDAAEKIAARLGVEVEVVQPCVI